MNGNNQPERSTYTMRTIILFAILSSAVCLSCTHKWQQSQSEATPEKELAIIGGSDTVASIQIISADKDTVIYDTPECYLWYVEDLPDEYKDKPISMWTERPVYWEDVQTINVFVANPTSDFLMFGRGWVLEQWNGTEWAMAKTKGDISWQDDAFAKEKAPLLYCFRFPVGKYYRMKKGEYRICKSFYAKRKKIELNAEFEIK